MIKSLTVDKNNKIKICGKTSVWVVNTDEGSEEWNRLYKFEKQNKVVYSVMYYVNDDGKIYDEWVCHFNGKEWKSTTRETIKHQLRIDRFNGKIKNILDEA